MRLNTFLLLLLSTLLVTRPCPAQDAIPDYLASATEHGSTWISEEAVNENGIVQWDLFSQKVAERLEREVDTYLKLHDSLDESLSEVERFRSMCPPRISCLRPPPGAPPLPWNLETLADQTVILLSGTVVEEKRGFLSGWANSVYRIRVDSAISPQDLSAPSHVLLAYEVAMARVGEGYVCGTNERDFKRPTVGSRVLLFHDEVTVSEPPVILDPLARRIVFELPDGTASVSRNLKDSQGRRFDDLVTEVTRRLLDEM